NGGLIVTGSALTFVRRDLIIALAARYKLPAVYYEQYYVAAGGLMSYGSNSVELFRLAAAYIDRILKARSLPSFRCKARLNMSLSSTLRLRKHSVSTVPSSLLARTDNVIE